MQPACITGARFQDQPQFWQTESNGVGRLDTGPVNLAVTGFKSGRDIYGNDRFTATLSTSIIRPTFSGTFSPESCTINGVYNQVRVH